MFVCKRTSDPDEMHNRKNTGALEVILCRSDRIRKKPTDMRGVCRQRWGAGRNETVDRPFLEQRGNRLAPGGVFELHVRGELDADFLRPVGIRDAATNPMNVRGLYAMVVLQN